MLLVDATHECRSNQKQRREGKGWGEGGVVGVLVCECVVWVRGWVCGCVGV